MKELNYETNCIITGGKSLAMAMVFDSALKLNLARLPYLGLEHQYYYFAGDIQMHKLNKKGKLGSYIAKHVTDWGKGSDVFVYTSGQDLSENPRVEQYFCEKSSCIYRNI